MIIFDAFAAREPVATSPENALARERKAPVSPITQGLKLGNDTPMLVLGIETTCDETAAAVVERRRHVAGDPSVKRPPIVPLFVAGFLLAVLIRSFLPLPAGVTDAADAVQTALLAMALFGLGTAVRLRSLVGTGWRALATGLLSWALIAALALAAVQLSH